MSKKGISNRTVFLSSLLLLLTFYGYSTLGAQVSAQRVLLQGKQEELEHLEEKKRQLMGIREEVEGLGVEKESFARTIPMEQSATWFLEDMLKIVEDLKGQVESLTPGEVSAYGADYKVMDFVLRYTSTKRESDLFIEDLCKRQYVQIIKMEQYEKGDGEVYVVLSLKMYTRKAA